jgi:hypothetical protein
MSATYTVQEYTVTQPKTATSQGTTVINEAGYVSSFVIYRTKLQGVVTEINQIITRITKRLQADDGSVLSQIEIPTSFIQKIPTNYVETSYYLPDQTMFLGLIKASSAGTISGAPAPQPAKLPV